MHDFCLILKHFNFSFFFFTLKETIFVFFFSKCQLQDILNLRKMVWLIWAQNYIVYTKIKKYKLQKSRQQKYELCRSKIQRLQLFLQWLDLPWGRGGPRPSGGSGAQPLGSAECNDCMQTPGGRGLVTSYHLAVRVSLQALTPGREQQPLAMLCRATYTATSKPPLPSKLSRSRN